MTATCEDGQLSRVCLMCEMRDDLAECRAKLAGETAAREEAEKDVDMWDELCMEHIRKRNAAEKRNAKLMQAIENEAAYCFGYADKYEKAGDPERAARHRIRGQRLAAIAAPKTEEIRDAP